MLCVTVDSLASGYLRLPIAACMINHNLIHDLENLYMLAFVSMLN